MKTNPRHHPWIPAAVATLGVLTASLLVAQHTTPGDHPTNHPPEPPMNSTDPSPKHTNALAGETSPYLLQHAHNPVNWHAWGPAAFEAARRSGKLIFLSVGYSTCYWCHVMERQVFENPQLAALMNEHCINIKVDREERPDVDDIYMAAVQIMTGHGGWPMSVFLTPPGSDGPDDPGLKPVWAGTYIPPEPRHGMPGIGQVVEGVSNAWKTRRQEVIKQANHVAQAVIEHLNQSDPPALLGPQLVQHAANQLLGMYDPAHGGFGSAPKFPQPANLLFLLAVYQNNPNDELWSALSHTLQRMAGGGMYDQVGGGFHRYSTDEKWLVPHFEKMLYDNGQLVEAYLTAQAIKPDAQDPGLYQRVAQETCDYVLREMTDPTGTFWSAQDAEVDSREGDNYVWTPQQVRHAAGDKQLGDLAVRMYGLDRGTNFQDPHHQDQPPANVLYLPERLDQTARGQKMTLEELVAARSQINQRLLAQRDQRPQPGTDDKVLVSWNGIMIAALARAGVGLDQPRYTQAAIKAAAYILDHMTEPQTPQGGLPGQGLHRTMRKGRVKTPAFLEDYAFFVHGLVQLNRATGQERWLKAAQDLMAVARHRFDASDSRRGGYHDTLEAQPDLFVRAVSTYDGAIPSGNSQMIHNLIDLHQLTGQRAYLDQAASDLQAFSGSLARRGAAMVHMQHALLRTLELAPERLGNTPRDADSTTAGLHRNVVAVSVEPETVDLSSGTAQVRVTLAISKGHHLNASNPQLSLLVPTTLELEPTTGFQMHVRYPPAVNKRYPFANDEIHVYENTVVLVATIQKNNNAASLDTRDWPKLVLRYQACTDHSCLEPTQVHVPVTFAGLQP